jgi:hypothetical protein
MQAGKAEGKGSASVKGTSVQRSHVGGGRKALQPRARSGVSLEQKTATRPGYDSLDVRIHRAAAWVALGVTSRGNTSSRH